MKKCLPLLLSVFILFTQCNKENDPVNESAMFAIPTGVGTSTIIPYYTIDNSGRFLFVFLRDFDFNNSKILKVNLATLKIEKQIEFEGTTNTTVPIMFDNVVVTDKNELISGFYNFYSGKQLLIKFDINLKILKVDTVAIGEGGNHGRTRLVRNGPGKITGVIGQQENSTGTTRWYLQYMHMDENLKILSRVNDTSWFYGQGPLIPSSFIKTSDGGFLLSAADDGSGYDFIIEKRDANFKLQWQNRNSDGLVPVTLNELNGKYYLYCHGDSVYTLMYDLKGNLLGKRGLNVDGTKLNLDYEPMRKTDNGEFLQVARVAYLNNRFAQTGVLFHSDANAGVISSQTFGGNSMLGACLIKINSNKYLLFYLDNSFEPDGSSQPRIVFRYVDARGNFLD